MDQTAGVVFVADDLGAWLVGVFADAGRKKLTTWVVGSDQERALRQAATAAIQLTALQLVPSGGQQAEQLAMVVSEVFREPVPDASLARQATLLQALQAGIAANLAVLDDSTVTGTGKSSAEALGVPGSELVETLAGHLLREIMLRGSGGGPLAPLADQLNHDVTHLQGQQLEGKLDRLVDLERALVSAVTGMQRPVAALPLPQGTVERPRLPNSLPRVWNVPARSAVFSGRDELLGQLRQRVESGSPVAVQALHGLGGVGKTLLAVEFAHRFAGDYDLVWWVNAEQPELVLEQFARLAVAATLVSGNTFIPHAAETALAYLRGTDRWLVVFDNAEDPAAIRPSLPEGPGHVLITSRNPAWSEVASPVEVDTFTRTESVHLLTRQVTTLTRQDADTIADQLGDLPLAIAQAAGVLGGTNMSASDYLNALRAETEQVLSTGAPVTYGTTLSAVVRFAMKKSADADPAAAELMTACAFLAPEPVPTAWFANLDQGDLPDALAKVASNPFQLRQCLTLLVRHGLARATAEGLLLHRLTAAITRHMLIPAEQEATRATAERLLAAATPVTSADLSVWAAWAAILPHLLHLDPATTSNDDIRELGCEATLVLYLRGDYRTGADLAQHLHQAWSFSLGADHPNTLHAANNLARCLYGMADYKGAAALDRDTLARRRRVLGEDAPGTLHSASNLARHLTQLGRMQTARELFQDTLTRTRKVLGDDHPETLMLASNLAAQHQQMRLLNSPTQTSD